MAWELVPCLAQLRADLNRLAPNRDKSSDGTIGDTAHQQSVSDHNDDEIGNVPIRDADSKHEVHAYDVDVDLREPNLTMEMVVQHVVGRCRSGAEKRLRYIIFNRRIWEQSNGWRQRTYSGDNPHAQHAHFSASYETAREADTSSWHLEELVALSADDRKWIADQLAPLKSTDFTVNPITQIQIPDYSQPAANRRKLAWHVWVGYGDVQHNNTRTAIATALAKVDPIDEAAVAAAVLAVLTPQAIAAALPDEVAEQVAQELAERLQA